MMHRDFKSDEIRSLILAVNAYDLQYGPRNCFFELFDGMNQIGVLVMLSEPLRRHAVRFKIGDEKSMKAAWTDMAEWANGAASSNGRTADFESANPGSNPGAASK
jgi:hypothetical protein